MLRTKVDVQHVGLRLFAYLRGLHHRAYLFSIDLDRYGSLLVGYVQLLLRLADIADQCVGRDELRIDHIGTKTFAHQAESNVGDIFHRGQKHGALT